MIAEPVAMDDRRVGNEKRSSGRSGRKLTAQLVSLAGTSQLHCPVNNVSDGGLYVRAATNCGLAVGQRYQVILFDELERGDAENLAGEGCYATVVRTNRVMDESGEQTGAAFRFDHPLFL